MSRARRYHSEMPEPLHWSLGYFKARGYTLSVFCPDMHGRQIDLDRAIERFGADFSVTANRAEFLESAGIASR